MEPVSSPRERLHDFEQVLARAEEMFSSPTPASRASRASKATLRGVDPQCQEKLPSKDELFFEVFRKATALFEAKKDGVCLPKEMCLRLYSLSRRASGLSSLCQKISSIFIEKIETEICGRSDFDYSFQIVSSLRLCGELLDINDVPRIKESLHLMLSERFMLRTALIYETLSFYRFLIFKKINEFSPFVCFKIIADNVSSLTFDFQDEPSVDAGAIEAIGMVESVQRMQSLVDCEPYLQKIGSQYPSFSPMAKQAFDCLMLHTMFQEISDLQSVFKEDAESVFICGAKLAKTQFARAFIDAWAQRKEDRLSLKIDEYFRKPEADAQGENVSSLGFSFLAESLCTLSRYERLFEKNTKGQAQVYQDGYRLLTDLLPHFCAQKKITESEARFLETKYHPTVFTNLKLPAIRSPDETVRDLNDISRWVHLFVYERRIDFLEELVGVGFEGRRDFGRYVLGLRSDYHWYSDPFASKNKPASPEKVAGPEKAKKSKQSAPKQKTSKKKKGRLPIQERPLKGQGELPVPEDNPAPMADGGEVELSGKGSVDAELSARMGALRISDEETPKPELEEEVVQVAGLAQNERSRQPRQPAAAALSTPCVLARRPVLHERVESWTAHIHPQAEILDGRLDPVTCHSFPILVSRLIKANSLPREFVSKATERVNQLYECIGSVCLPGERAPVLTGIFEDCYDRDTLYHHFFRQMHSKAILQWRSGEGASCAHIEQALHEVVPQHGREQPVACYSPDRYRLEKGTFSVTVVDQASGIKYIVVFPEPLQ